MHVDSAPLHTCCSCEHALRRADSCSTCPAACMPSHSAWQCQNLHVAFCRPHGGRQTTSCRRRSVAAPTSLLALPRSLQRRRCAASADFVAPSANTHVHILQRSLATRLPAVASTRAVTRCGLQSCCSAMPTDEMAQHAMDSPLIKQTALWGPTGLAACCVEQVGQVCMPNVCPAVPGRDGSVAGSLPVITNSAVMCVRVSERQVVLECERVLCAADSKSSCDKESQRCSCSRTVIAAAPKSCCAASTPGSLLIVHVLRPIVLYSRPQQPEGAAKQCGLRYRHAARRCDARATCGTSIVGVSNGSTYLT